MFFYICCNIKSIKTNSQQCICEVTQIHTSTQEMATAFSPDRSGPEATATVKPQHADSAAGLRKTTCPAFTSVSAQLSVGIRTQTVTRKTQQVQSSTTVIWDLWISGTRPSLLSPVFRGNYVRALDSVYKVIAEYAKFVVEISVEKSLRCV